MQPLLLRIVVQRVWSEIEISKHAKLYSDLYFALMIQFSHFLSNNSTTIQIELSKCFWFHDVEKLNVFKNCRMEECPCNIARVVQPCKTQGLKPKIGGLPKNGASIPHWWTFICRRRNTEFDVSTKTHLHKNWGFWYPSLDF